MGKPILVFINDTALYVPASNTVLQACEQMGIVIPRFCYHDLLEIAGNCRMCLVEIKGSPKPQVSCGLPVLDQMHIYTNTPLVKKAREGVIEFLLLNHPLDCPICDQGGECDLQNQAIAFGNTIGRFYKFKRSVEDKGLGPLIKTIITRCIHCTRCIRFAWDIAGLEDLGTTLRGNLTEVGTYLKKTLNSEVSANLIDLCPVGALTSKVYAFKARPWEVSSHITIDTSDSLGSNTTTETKNSRILRVIPRTNIKINYEWLSDKARYAYEGNTSQRLSYPHYKRKKRLVMFKTHNSIRALIEGFLVKSSGFKIKMGRNLDLESLNLGKVYGRKLGADVESETPNNLPSSYPIFFQSTLSLDHISFADSCFLLGINLRSEATLANLRLRARFKEGLLTLYSFGNPLDLTYACKSYGLNLNHLVNLGLGKHILSLGIYKNPLIVYGDSLSSRHDGFSILQLAYKVQKVKNAQNWQGCYRFPLGSNSIGKSFLGLSRPVFKLFREAYHAKIVSYMLGIENKITLKKERTRILLETTHLNAFLKRCNFILPMQSVLERTGHYINATGLVQKSKEVLRFGVKPFRVYDQFIQKLKAKPSPYNENFNKLEYDKLFFKSCFSKELSEIGIVFSVLKLKTFPFKTMVGDMYKTDNSSSTSLTLAKVSANLRNVYWHFL